VDRVKKVLREVKIQDDIKEPQDLPEKGMAEFDDIPDDDGVDKALKAVKMKSVCLKNRMGLLFLICLLELLK
jgi:hypothetical protein